jgi:hypothetical protein
MKKIFTLLTAAAVVSFLSTSCNKKLKENMDELEASLNEEKAKNESLQNQVNTLNNAFVRSPLTVNFSTTNNDDETVSASGDYQIIVGTDYLGSVMLDNDGDGTYNVTVARTPTAVSPFGPGTYSSIEFTYNPTTGVITNLEAYNSGFSSQGQYFEGEFYEDVECTQSLTVIAFDFNAGTISFNYSASTTVDYGNNAFGNPMTLTLKYSGSLTKSYYSNMQ